MNRLPDRALDPAPPCAGSRVRTRVRHKVGLGKDGNCRRGPRASVAVGGASDAEFCHRGHQLKRGLWCRTRLTQIVAALVLEQALEAVEAVNGAVADLSR